MINTPLQTFQISSRCLSISVRPNGCLRGHVDNSSTGVLCQTHRQRRSAQYVTARMCICRRSLRRLIYRSGRPGSIMRSCPHHASAGDLSSAPLPRASTLPLPQSLLIYSMASPSTCLLNHLVGDIGTLRACATASSTMRVAAQRQLFGRCIVADSAACSRLCGRVFAHEALGTYIRELHAAFTLEDGLMGVDTSAAPHVIISRRTDRRHTRPSRSSRKCPACACSLSGRLILLSFATLRRHSASVAPTLLSSSSLIARRATRIKLELPSLHPCRRCRRCASQGPSRSGSERFHSQADEPTSCSRCPPRRQQDSSASCPNRGVLLSQHCGEHRPRRSASVHSPRDDQALRPVIILHARAP
jgi:hypothetical protein